MNTEAERVLKRRIFDILIEVGMSAGLDGFKYSMEAIQLLIENGNLSTTKELYPSIAKKCATSPQRVERCIRNAISVAFERGDIQVLKQYFKNSYSPKTGRPTNTEFLKTLAYILMFQE